MTMRRLFLAIALYRDPVLRFTWRTAWRLAAENRA